MRYRLTVKGKVVVAAIAALAVLIPGSFILGGNRQTPSAPVASKPLKEASKSAAVPVENPKTKTTEASVRAEELNAMRQLHARIQFLPNEWENPSGLDQLDLFVKYAQKYPDVKLAVIGNINGYPDLKIDGFGKVLSEKRANVVAQYLMVKGISETRIVIESQGIREPAVSMQDEENYWKNRRTEVYFILTPQ